MKKKLIFLLSLGIIISCTKKKKDGETASGNDSIAIYKWETELCSYQGEYNATKITEEELNNTFNLWFQGGYRGLEADATVFEPADIKKLSIDTLTKEYNERMSKLKAMKIVKDPFWEKLKQASIQELEEEYELKKITIEAHSNPSVLLKNKYTKYCEKYAKVLASNKPEELLKAWKKMSEEDTANYASSMERYHQKYNSKDRLLYAKIELMTFGWWNCANNYIHHVEIDGKYETAFADLFKNIKSECSEP